MQLQLIRSATIRFQYGGHTFLIDPYLAARHSRPTYAGKSRNPLVELPFPVEQVLEGIEMVMLSHLHSDHFDPAAQEALPKSTLLLCQPEDEKRLHELGFNNLIPVSGSVSWQGITFSRTPCQHGSGAVLEQMGTASGFIFRAQGEPTVYWTGDTIWYEGTAGIVAKHQPDVIITHSAGAQWGEGVLILMDAAQTVEACRVSGRAVVVATHMDSVDHATVSRQALREFATQSGIDSQKLRIPLDGETLTFNL